MPFKPAPFIEQEQPAKTAEILTKYQLNAGYYFYPAQLWAHKNHVRILQALKSLKSAGLDRKVVFCGGDQGNLEFVTEITRQLRLENDVVFLGFVSPDDMRALYDGCAAVVMPTYFGPTNLPPLEAWKQGKPLIYSAHLSAQAGDAAIFVNPDSAEDLANAMRKVLETDVAVDLVKKGYSRLMEIDRERELAEKEMLNLLTRFSKRLECWKQGPQLSSVNKPVFRPGTCL